MMTRRRAARWAGAAAAVAVVAGCSAPPTVVTPAVSAAGTQAPSPASTAHHPAPGSPESAAAVLGRLPVAAAASTVGYDRDVFGQRWSDDIDVDGGHNSCDQRSDTLRRDLQSVAIKPSTQGCVPATGTLLDPYTGTRIDFVRGSATSGQVQIDHVVALAAAWRTGAQQWTAQQRQDFAGDPLELLAVDGPTNQAKGDSDASEWLPPDRAYRCPYVARQIAVKAKYGLWVTPDEAATMTAVLTSCPGEQLSVDSDVPNPVR